MNRTALFAMSAMSMVVFGMIGTGCSGDANSRQDTADESEESASTDAVSKDALISDAVCKGFVGSAARVANASGKLIPGETSTVEVKFSLLNAPAEPDVSGIINYPGASLASKDSCVTVDQSFFEPGTFGIAPGQSFVAKFTVTVPPEKKAGDSVSFRARGSAGLVLPGHKCVTPRYSFSLPVGTR
jgi:hypothetical protein